MLIGSSGRSSAPRACSAAARLSPSPAASRASQVEKPARQGARPGQLAPRRRHIAPNSARWGAREPRSAPFRPWAAINPMTAQPTAAQRSPSGAPPPSSTRARSCGSSAAASAAIPTKSRLPRRPGASTSTDTPAWRSAYASSAERYAGLMLTCGKEDRQEAVRPHAAQRGWNQSGAADTGLRFVQRTATWSAPGRVPPSRARMSPEG